MARKVAGGTPAVQVLLRAGVVHTLHPYPHDPRAESYGAEAARAPGVDPARVFKTLLVDADGDLVVAIVPVARRLDLKALARVAGARRTTMADPAAAQRATGYVVGGISPLGQNPSWRPRTWSCSPPPRRPSSPRRSPDSSTGDDGWDEPPRERDQPLPAPARRQPGGLVGVGARGVRRGEAP